MATDRQAWCGGGTTSRGSCPEREARFTAMLDELVACCARGRPRAGTGPGCGIAVGGVVLIRLWAIVAAGVAVAWGRQPSSSP